MSNKRAHALESAFTTEKEDQKKIWFATIENDMRAAGLYLGDVEDRDK